MRRQIRRHSTRRSTSSSSFQRHLGRVCSRLLHSGGRVRGNAPLLDPPSGPTQVTLGLHSYRTVEEQGLQDMDRCGAFLREEAHTVGLPGPCRSVAVDLEPCTPESPASPLSFQSVDSVDEEELSPVSSRAPQSEPPTPCQSDSSAHSGVPLTPQEATAPPCHRRASKKLVLELAVNLTGVSLRRYSPLGPLSPISPPTFPGSSQAPSTQTQPQRSEGTSPADPLSSPVKAEDSDSHFTMDVPSREIRSRDDRKTEGKTRLCRFSRALSNEGGDPGRETQC